MKKVITASTVLLLSLVLLAPELKSRGDYKKKSKNPASATVETASPLPKNAKAKRTNRQGRENQTASAEQVYFTNFEGANGEWTAFNLGAGNNFEWVSDNSNSPSHSWHVADDDATTEEAAKPITARLVSPSITLPTTVNGTPVTRLFADYFYDVDTPNTSDGGFVYDVWEALIEVPFAGPNLWHASNSNAFAGNSWFCGLDATGTYTDNTRQELRTPVLNLSTVTGPVTLSFKNFDSIEAGYDFGYVEVSSNGGASWITLATYSEDKSTVAYTDASFDITPYATSQTMVRWRFESDGGAQGTFGWHVDNVTVKDANTTFLFDDGGDTASQLAAVANPLAFSRLHYDYDRGGHANPTWQQETNTTIFNGSLDVLQYAGMTVRFALQVSTDGWNRLGIPAGRGSYFDDFQITADGTLANDVALIDLDVPFPNIASFDAQLAQARVKNVGSNNQPTVLTRYRINNGAVTLPLPPVPVSVAPNAEVAATFNWRLLTGSAPGDYKLTALTTLGQDQNRSNDTLSVEPVTVYPEGLAELGYDDRFNQDQFITATTCLVNFSVLNDLRGLTGTYDLNVIRIDLYNASATADEQLRIVVATAENDTTPGDILYDANEPIPAADFSSHFLDINAKGLTSSRLIVLVDFSVSGGNARVVMDGRTRFTGHNFARSGGIWVASSFGRQIRAWISWLAAPDIISVRDVRNDNGRQVHVTWFPSPNESFSSDISHYVLWRAAKGAGANVGAPRAIEVPSMQAMYDYGIQKGKPGDRVSVASSGTWDYITVVPSHPGFTAYGYVAPTLADSNASGRNYATFMVTAYDVFGSFVDSKVDSGYSVDNIAPSVPAGLTATVVPAGQNVAVQLNWKAVEDEDLAYYAVYKNDAATPLSRTTSLTFNDPNVTVGTMVKYSVTAFDINGNQSAAANATVNVTKVADRPGNAIPTEYALDNNYPNPFNPQTTIEFALPAQGHVKLVILNSVGQEIETLIDRDMQPGYHHAVWNANKFTSGVYFYRLTASHFSQLKKMVLAK